MTHDPWLAQHPYLQPVADLHRLVDAATAEVCIPIANVSDWSGYAHDYQTGVTLLGSCPSIVGLGRAEETFPTFLERVAEKPLPVEIASQCQSLLHEIHQTPNAPIRAIAWLLGKDDLVTAHPDLVYFLGWKFLASYLSVVVSEFSNWRDEDRWLRNYCPTCGGSPAMSQLISNDSAHLRLLSCGYCRTRWRYHRIGCPFCEKSDHHRLATLMVEGQSRMRIDYCENCSGYLKTYYGQGMEAFMLADWTSLHLDLIAGDRGLKRLGGTLYKL